MADENGGDRSSFVNEGFDELNSEEGSGASLKNQMQQNPEETREETQKNGADPPSTHMYAALETITLNVGPREGNGSNEPETSDVKRGEEEKPKPKLEPFYDAPKLEPYYDEPILRSKQPNVPPSYPPPRLPAESAPTLSLDEDDGGQGSPQRGGASIAPSSAVATSDETSHRPLPAAEARYETIPDSLRGGAGEDASNFDLQVNITDHEKQTISKTESFITYKIETTSIRPRHLYEKSEYTVWRRYRDFEWLHDQLERNHPTLILPPLPGKQITRYFDHMSETFLEERQRCLDQFLWRIVSHPFFSYDNAVKMFLTADDEQFIVYVNETAGSSKFLDIFSSSVKQATTSIRLKSPDASFTENSKYFSNFSDKMGVLERIETRLQSDRNELSSSLGEMSEACSTWSATESQLEEGIKKVGEAFNANVSALNNLNDSNSYSFQLAIRMYQNYSASAVSALKRRDALQLEHEIAIDEKERKKKLHEEAVQAGKTEKVTKIATELEKLGVTAEHTQDKLAQANEQLRVDVEKWKESKDNEVKQIFLNWTSNQILYHEKMFREWEEVLLLLRQLGSDEDFVDQY